MGKRRICVVNKHHFMQKFCGPAERHSNPTIFEDTIRHEASLRRFGYATLAPPFDRHMFPVGSVLCCNLAAAAPIGRLGQHPTSSPCAGRSLPLSP
jgi:hypothetical protein